MVQISHARVQIRGKAEPSQIWNHAPTSNIVDPKVEIRQVAVQANERQDVGKREDRSTEPEEQRHPRQIQAELGRVQAL